MIEAFVSIITVFGIFLILCGGFFRYVCEDTLAELNNIKIGIVVIDDGSGLCVDDFLDPPSLQEVEEEISIWETWAVDYSAICAVGIFLLMCVMHHELALGLPAAIPFASRPLISR